MSGNYHNASVGDKGKLDIYVVLNWGEWSETFIEPSPEWQAVYDRFVESRSDKTIFEDINGFAKWLHEQGHTVEAFPHQDDTYPDGDYSAYNTYNNPDAYPFGATLQYTCFYVDGIFIYVISEHIGRDVRLSYADPKIYIDGDMGGELALFHAGATVLCNCSDTQIQLDEGGAYATGIVVDSNWTITLRDMVTIDGESALANLQDDKPTPEDMIAAMIYEGVLIGRQAIANMSALLGVRPFSVLTIGDGYKNNLHCPVCGSIMGTYH